MVVTALVDYRRFRDWCAVHLRRRVRAARSSCSRRSGRRARARRPGSSSAASSSSRPSSPRSALIIALAAYWPPQFRGELDLRRLVRRCSSLAVCPIGADHAAARPRHRARVRRRSLLGVLLVAGPRPRHLAVLGAGRARGCGVVAAARACSTQYQMDRLTAFLDQDGPKRPRPTQAYNLDQSKIAIGVGRRRPARACSKGSQTSLRLRARAAHRLHLHRGGRGARLRRRRHAARPVRADRLAHLADRAARAATCFGTLVCVGVLAHARVPGLRERRA